MRFIINSSPNCSFQDAFFESVDKRSGLLALISGILIVFSFPKFGNGLVIWFALVPLLLGVKGKPVKIAIRDGFIAGFIANLGILYWITYVIVNFGYLPLYIGILVTALLAGYLSLYYICFTGVIVYMEKKGIPFSLSAPSLWTILEYFRSILLTGFPWENIAYSQYLNRYIIQIADITGIYGISWLIVFTNTVICSIILRKKQRDLLLKELPVCILIITLVIIYGNFRIKDIELKIKEAPEIDLTIIQGNIDQNIKWNSHYQEETIRIYEELSLQSGANDLIIWPETAAPFYFQQSTPLQETVKRIPIQSNSSLIFGSPSYEKTNGDISYMNSAFIINSKGMIMGRYDKVHLVPFGEYVPLKDYLPFIKKIAFGIGDFKAGKGYYPLTDNRYKFGVLICYEAIFPEAASEYKKRKVDFLVNITNDAWFARTSAPYQHLSMTVLRAVENRLYLARAANTGISAIIDPTGKIISKTDLFLRAILKGKVKSIDEETYYSAYGNVFVFICLIIIMLCFINITVRRVNNDGRN